MENTLVAKRSITIKASTSKVWNALIDPEMIKQYLFGTTAISDWKVGSSITYRGEWEGKSYEDKGTILRMEPEKLMESTYWSSMSGKEDKPENYIKVTYELFPKGEETTLTISQDNGTAETDDHAGDNWEMVLKSLKELLEK